MNNVWQCRIGECNGALLPMGADMPMRDAVQRAYRVVTGVDDVAIFSGWGRKFTEGERAVIEARMPVDDLVGLDQDEINSISKLALDSDVDFSAMVLAYRLGRQHERER